MERRDPRTDVSRNTDSYVAEIKGPGPEWDDATRPEATNEPPPLEVGEIRNEGTDEEVKGPGHQWATDDAGAYVSR